MHPTPAVSFLLPCLNEQEGLEVTIRELLQTIDDAGMSAEVLIVDNGSTDDSTTIVERIALNDSRVRLLHEKAPGYGAAILCGAREAAGTTIVTLDADGTYPAADAITCATIARHENTLALGNRFHVKKYAANMPAAHRVLGTPGFAFALRALFGIRVADPNCGLRGFTRTQLTQLACRSTGMEFATESIVLAAHANITIVEFPVSYRPRIGASKLRTVRDGLRNLVSMISTRVRLRDTHQPPHAAHRP